MLTEKGERPQPKKSEFVQFVFLTESFTYIYILIYTKNIKCM